MTIICKIFGHKFGEEEYGISRYQDTATERNKNKSCKRCGYNKRLTGGFDGNTPPKYMKYKGLKRKVLKLQKKQEKINIINHQYPREEWGSIISPSDCNCIKEKQKSCKNCSRIFIGDYEEFCDDCKKAFKELKKST